MNQAALAATRPEIPDTRPPRRGPGRPGGSGLRRGAAELRSTEVVVPLFRERSALGPLFEALGRTLPELPGCRVLFVDDGSGDGTAELCAERIAAAPALGARLLRHRRNLGLAAALRTGFRAGSADVQCWLDADLSYDPAILVDLVAEVGRGAGVALASPYHPAGGVESVPPLRLLLSRGLSRAYRLLEGPGPWTWSSMVRAWRRGCLARCLPDRDGHAGVTETLLRARAIGIPVAEVPATLRGRAAGRSGLRLVPGILGQIGLMRDAVLGRLAPER